MWGRGDLNPAIYYRSLPIQIYNLSMHFLHSQKQVQFLDLFKKNFLNFRLKLPTMLMDYYYFIFQSNVVMNP